MCQHDVALEWAHGKKAPTYEECLQGDTVTMFYVYSETSQTLRDLTSKLFLKYPEHRCVGRRERKDRPVKVFDMCLTDLSKGGLL